VDGTTTLLEETMIAQRELKPRKGISSAADAIVSMWVMTHKYRRCIVILSINKSVEPNEKQKVLTSGFD
jgi:hypothetical protein